MLACFLLPRIQARDGIGEYRAGVELPTLCCDLQGRIPGQAVLAYVQLTMTCVECHKHVRETRRAGIDTDESDRHFLSSAIDRNGK